MDCKSWTLTKVNFFSENTQADLPSTPWGQILRSKPVWALVLAAVGNGCGLLTMLSEMPKYMSSVLKFSVEDNGLLSSLPYLGLYFLIINFS